MGMWFFRAFRRTSSRRISDEVWDELAHHHAMVRQSHLDAGRTPEEADRRSDEQMGDLHAHHAQSMSIRDVPTPHDRATFAGLVAGALGTLTFLGLFLHQKFTSVDAAALPLPASAEEKLNHLALERALDQLARLPASSERTSCFQAAQVILDMPSKDALSAGRKLYAKLERADSRQALLEGIVNAAEQRHVLEFLDLGMHDADIAVRGWAAEQLATYALQDFSTNAESYREWFEAFRSKSIDEVVRASVTSYEERIAALDGAALVDALGILGLVDLDRLRVGGDDISELLRGAGAWDLVAHWLATGNTDVRAAALEWATTIGVDPRFVSQVVAPAMDGSHTWDDRTFKKLCMLYGDSAHERALRDLERFARERLPNAPLVAGQDSPSLRAAVIAMGRNGDPRAIHAVLALLVDRQDFGMCRLVGEALERPTGVARDDTHDLAWWRQWWNENEERLPEGSRALGFPTPR